MPHSHHGAVGSIESVLLTLIFVSASLVYLRGWLDLRSRRQVQVPAWRVVGFHAALFLIWVAVASPIAELDKDLLTAHMVQHLLLMTIAPPLIWLGEPALLVMHNLPEQFVHALSPVFRWPPVPKLGRTLFRPTFCLVAASAVLVGWHIPTFFALGMRSATWHAAEQASFLATGLLFWWPVFQPWPSVTRPDLFMILYLFFATLPCDILSGFLVFCDRVIYPMYLSSSKPFGLSALEDQQMAGALMWTCVTVVYLVAGAILTMRLLSPQSLKAGKFLIDYVPWRGPRPGERSRCMAEDNLVSRPYSTSRR